MRKGPRTNTGCSVFSVFMVAIMLERSRNVKVAFYLLGVSPPVKLRVSLDCLFGSSALSPTSAHCRGANESTMCFPPRRTLSVGTGVDGIGIVVFVPARFGCLSGDFLSLLSRKFQRSGLAPFESAQATKRHGGGVFAVFRIEFLPPRIRDSGPTCRAALPIRIR